MTPRALRPWLAVLFLIMLVIRTGDVFVWSRPPVYDAQLTPVLDAKDLSRVTAVTPKSFAERQGVRAGDTLRTPPRVDVRLYAQSLAPLRVFDERLQRDVILTDTGPKRPLESYLAFITSVIVISLGMLVLLLRGERWSGFALAAFLGFIGFSEAGDSGRFLGTWAQIGFSTLQPQFQVLSGAALVGLAVALSTPTRGGKLAWRLSLLLASAMCVFGFYEDALTTNGYVDWTQPYPVSSWFTLVLLIIAGWAFVAGLTASEGTTRRRLLIVAAATTIGQFSATYALFGTPGMYTGTVEYVSDISLLVMALGLVYAIVVERLFDIGFVVNRAVVFASVSAAVVPLFIVVEWGAGKFAERIGHVESTTIEMVLALAIGLSLRPIHRGVDRVVDALLFAKRHRAANAITRFAAEVPLISDRERLIENLVWTLRTYARVMDCDVLLRDEDGVYYSATGSGRRMDADDLIAVRLRATRAPVSRTEYPGLTDADEALPMTVRGELTGVVFCKLSETEEPYSPEEIDALRLLAREVAFTIVSLEAAEAKMLREQLASLRFASP